MKLDVLAVAAHPDDAELAIGGTLAKLAANGNRVGILDLTRGELGTRGTPEIRAEEAAQAAEILGLAWRGNLGLPDGRIEDTPAQRLPVINALRVHRPRLLLINAPTDRHPDHGAAQALVRNAAFFAGLRKYPGAEGPAHRPERVYSYIQDEYLTPSFILDVSGYMDVKLAAIRAYGSQFYDPTSTEPATYIASERFLDYIRARAVHFGHLIGTQAGEGFLSERPVAVTDLFATLPPDALTP